MLNPSSKFQLHLIEKHAFIQVDSLNILIDTGAPSSLSMKGSFSFLGKTYTCPSKSFGFDLENISELLGHTIDVLMGNDILSNHMVEFNYREHYVAFDTSGGFADIPTSQEFTIEQFMGIPVVTLHVNQQAIKCFLDTGATLSYLNPAITQRYTSKGTKEDFYPNIGKFLSPVFEVAARMGELEFLMDVGHLPELFALTLTLSNTQGILGYDFFASFKVRLNLRENKLTIG